MDPDNVNPPYKATKLWNHAVTLFCTEMPVHKHRRRMKYYPDCFTGGQAVSWFHKALVESPCFDQEVTKKQSQQLLGKFLKAGVFYSIKGHTHFKKNSLYRFTKEDYSGCETNAAAIAELIENNKEELKVQVNSKSTGLQIMDKNKAGSNSQNASITQVKENELKKKVNACHKVLPEHVWKKCIIERIQELLPGEDIISKLPESINSKWVLINGSPEYATVRKRTFLPNWVASAICNVLHSEKKHPKISYPSFTEDVVNTVYDYFHCLSLPIIPAEFYNIIIFIFLHLMKIDENTKRQMYLNVPFNSKSVENLLLGMSSPQRHIDASKMKHTLLPANSCFETAFTSDVPITRIVPQSSIDTVFLAGKVSLNHQPVPATVNMESDLNEVHCNPIQRSVSKAQNFQNICKKYIPVKRSKSVRKADSLLCEHEKREVRPASHANKIDFNWPNQNTDGGFVNFGLSKSLDNINSENMHELDLIEALDSLQVLVDATKQSCDKYYSDISLSEDDTCSNYETDSSSEEPVQVKRRFGQKCCSTSMSKVESFEGTNLLPSTLSLADSIYLLVFTLMPPECRTTVSLVLKFLHHLQKHSQRSPQIFHHFSKKLLRSTVAWDPSADHNLAKRVLYFLMERNTTIFTDLPAELIVHIDSQVEQMYHMQRLQENVFCQQVAKRKTKKESKARGFPSIVVKMKNLRL